MGRADFSQLYRYAVRWAMCEGVSMYTCNTHTGGWTGRQAGRQIEVKERDAVRNDCTRVIRPME
jgi:hypothetical protein